MVDFDWDKADDRHRDAWLTEHALGLRRVRVPALSMQAGLSSSNVPDNFPFDDCDQFFDGDEIVFSTDYGCENNVFFRPGGEVPVASVPHWSTDPHDMFDMLWKLDEKWGPLMRARWSNAFAVSLELERQHQTTFDALRAAYDRPDLVGRAVWLAMRELNAKAAPGGGLGE